MSDAAQITCECGKTYKWKPELAGKRGRCKCGAILKFPKEPPQAEVEDSYDLDDLPPAVTHAPANIVERPAAPAIGSASGIAAPEFKARKSYNWRGALWPMAFVLLMFAGGIYHIIDPHDPYDDGGLRRRFLQRVIELVYNIGGNNAVVGAFFLLGLLGLAVSYWILVSGSDNTAEE